MPDLEEEVDASLAVSLPPPACTSSRIWWNFSFTVLTTNAHSLDLPDGRDEWGQDESVERGGVEWVGVMLTQTLTGGRCDGCWERGSRVKVFRVELNRPQRASVGLLCT